MREFLPLLMPRFSELTRKVSDWPEHGRIFQQRGGRPVRVSRLLAPIQSPPSIRDFCAFEESFRNLCRRRGIEMPQAWYDVPAFYFSNPNSLIGFEDEVTAPKGETELDYELELGIVIGRRVRNVPAASAWDCVAGFTIVNDFAARELQRRELVVGFGPAKGSDFATAIGPVLVTRDEFSDKIDGRGLRLDMRARVNGRELSRGNSSSLFHAIPRMIEHASADADLYPGEIIATGAIGGGSDPRADAGSDQWMVESGRYHRARSGADRNPAQPRGVALNKPALSRCCLEEPAARKRNRAVFNAVLF